MNKISEQLQQKNPAMADAARLAVLAADALRSAGRNAVTAHDGFLEKVLADRGLVLALIGTDQVSRAALNYLHRIRADMVRSGASRTDGADGHAVNATQREHAAAPSASLPGKGQKTGDRQITCAQPRHPIEDAEGQVTGVFHKTFAPASSTPLHGEGQNLRGFQVTDAQSMQPVEGGSGLHIVETHEGYAATPSPHDSGRGHGNVDAQESNASSAVIPQPRRAPSAMTSIQGIMGKFIVFRLQDGRNIMDAQFHELEKIEKRGVKRAADFAREAIVARYLRENCTYANPDPFEKVGKYFPQKIIELAIAEADKKEAAHA